MGIFFNIKWCCLYFKYYEFVCIIQWFPTRDHFGHRKHLVIFRDLFGYHNWWKGGTSIWWVEARGAAKHPTVHSLHHRVTWAGMSAELRLTALAKAKFWTFKKFILNMSYNTLHRHFLKNIPIIHKHLINISLSFP